MRNLLVIALAVLVAAPFCVHAIQWTKATIDQGNLWYPGITITFSFWRASDVRVANFMTDGTVLTLQTDTYTWFTGVQPQQITGYCDGCVRAPPFVNRFALVNAANPNQTLWQQAMTVPACSYVTLQVSGAVHTGQGVVVNVIFENPKYYQVNFYTGTQPGAFHASTSYMPFTTNQACFIDAFVPIPHPQQLRGYNRFTPVFVNMTRADTVDGDFRTYVLYTNNTVPSPWTTAPFFYGVIILNNNGLFTSGSQLGLTGCGLDLTSQYQCVFNNTFTNAVYTSDPTNPTSNSQFSCMVPFGMDDVSNQNDFIQLINITLFSPGNSGSQAFAYAEVTSNSGNNPTWRYQALGGSPAGLNGGQIFGIVLAVLIGVALIGYGGYYCMKKYQFEQTGYIAESSKDPHGAQSAQQIQSTGGHGYQSDH